MNPIATAIADSPDTTQPGAARETDARFQFQQAVAKQAQLEQLLKQGRAILLDLRSRFDQVCAQRDQLATELDELKNQHQQFQSEQAQLRLSRDESHTHALQLKDEQIDGLRAERTTLAAEREALAVQLIERDMQLAERNAQLAERDAHLAERDMRVREYDSAHEQMIEERAELEKALANHRVELEAMEQTVKRLEPLAEAGRLAREVGDELRSAAEEIDARAGRLLADLEQLRSDAVRAGSLGRQLVERDQSRVEE